MTLKNKDKSVNVQTDGATDKGTTKLYVLLTASRHDDKMCFFPLMLPPLQNIF